MQFVQRALFSPPSSCWKRFEHRLHLIFIRWRKLQWKSSQLKAKAARAASRHPSQIHRCKPTEPPVSLQELPVLPCCLSKLRVLQWRTYHLDKANNPLITPQIFPSFQLLAPQHCLIWTWIWSQLQTHIHGHHLIRGDRHLGIQLCRRCQVWKMVITSSLLLE